MLLGCHEHSRLEHEDTADGKLLFACLSCHTAVACVASAAADLNVSKRIQHSCVCRWRQERHPQPPQTPVCHLQHAVAKCGCHQWHIRQAHGGPIQCRSLLRCCGPGGLTCNLLPGLCECMAAGGLALAVHFGSVFWAFVVCLHCTGTGTMYLCPGLCRSLAALCR